MDSKFIITPYSIDRSTYDATIDFFRKIISKTKISVLEKQKILQRLI